MIVEGVSLNRLANADEGGDETEYLLDRGLEEDEIQEIVSNRPSKVAKDETCSICLCDFETSDGTMQMPN